MSATKKAEGIMEELTRKRQELKTFSNHEQEFYEKKIREYAKLEQEIQDLGIEESSQYREGNAYDAMQDIFKKEPENPELIAAYEAIKALVAKADQRFNYREYKEIGQNGLMVPTEIYEGSVEIRVANITQKVVDAIAAHTKGEIKRIYEEGVTKKRTKKEKVQEQDKIKDLLTFSVIDMALVIAEFLSFLNINYQVVSEEGKSTTKISLVKEDSQGNANCIPLLLKSESKKPQAAFLPAPVPCDILNPYRISSSIWCKFGEDIIDTCVECLIKHLIYMQFAKDRRLTQDELYEHMYEFYDILWDKLQPEIMAIQLNHIGTGTRNYNQGEPKKRTRTVQIIQLIQTNGEEK